MTERHRKDAWIGSNFDLDSDRDLDLDLDLDLGPITDNR